MSAVYPNMNGKNNQKNIEQFTAVAESRKTEMQQAPDGH